MRVCKKISYFMNLRQGNIILKMKLYLNLLGKQRRFTELAAGSCFGFAVCEEVMRKMGMLTWWKAVKEEWVKWDGTIEALNELVTLPGAEPTSRRIIFKFALRKILVTQGITNKFTKQIDFLKPGSPLLIVDEKNKTFNIKSYFVIGAHFDEQSLVVCLNEAATKAVIQNGICVVVSEDRGHCGLLGLDEDDKWRFFDANYKEGESKSFLNIEALIAELFARLGPTISIHLSSFSELSELQTQPFAAFKAALLKKSTFNHNLLHNHGLHLFVLETPELVPALLANFPDLPLALLNQKDNRGYTPLMYGIIENQPKVVKALIEANAFDREIINQPFTCLAKKPVELAIEHNATAALAMLLGLGADANVVNESGDTPLLSAAKTGNEEAVIYLLIARANVNVMNNIGETPLSVAVERNQTNMVLSFLGMEADLSVRNKQGQCLLSIAARNQNALLLKAICERGANPNQVSATKITPLMEAVATGQLELVQILLTNQANPWYQCPAKDYMQYLESMNVNIKTFTKTRTKGFTTIHMAILLNHPQIVTALLNAMPGITLRELKRLKDLALTLEHQEIATLINEKMLPMLSIQHSFFSHPPAKTRKKRIAKTSPQQACLVKYNRTA